MSMVLRRRAGVSRRSAKRLRKIRASPPDFPNARRARGMLSRELSAKSEKLSARRMKWRLLLPGASEPRLAVLTRQDFKMVFQTA
jgi:hypothetical protein